MGTTYRKQLVLASSSPRRQELIRCLPLAVTIVPSHADETVEGNPGPADIVEILAQRKAEAVAGRMEMDEPGRIVVGSDTIVVLGERVLGKPADDQDAIRMLELLQGKNHDVYSGVACLDLDTGRKIVRHRRTKVRLKPLSREQIERYVATGEPSDKAGAYAIQGFGSVIVDSIEGCYFNVVGLPLSLLSDMLGELGVQVI